MPGELTCRLTYTGLETHCGSSIFTMELDSSCWRMRPENRPTRLCTRRHGQEAEAG